MKITLHRPGVGVTDTGQWVEFRYDDGQPREADTGEWLPPVYSGKWVPIERPAWATERPAKAVAPVHPMADPYERQAPTVPLVTVRRTVTRTVPDYEAEVLVKEGWVIVPPDSEPTGRIPIGRLPRENVLQSDEAESSADTQGGT